MKKTLSIIVALVMMFALCIPAFAEGEVVEKPTDPVELGIYYAERFNTEGATTELVTELMEDYLNGNMEDPEATFNAFVENSDNPTAAYALLATVEGILQQVDPNFTLPVNPPSTETPDEELPDEELPEEELPEDEGDDFDFLNTILGILGSIGDMIFGGGDETPSEPSDGDEAFPDDEANIYDDDDDELISDTGDTTVLSVAAVALVAGAALVLTRKKSEDAE